MFIIPVGSVCVSATNNPEYRIAAMLVSAILLAGISVTLLGFPRCMNGGKTRSSFDRWAFLLCAEALLLFVSLHLPLTLMQQRQFWGMPAQKVVSLTGRLKEDSVPFGQGKIRLVLKAESVCDGFGNRAQAAGTLFVLCRSGTELYSGTGITLPVTLRRISENPQEWFAVSVSEPVVIEKPEGIGGLRNRVSAFTRHRLKSAGRNAGPLLETLVLGYRDTLSNRWVDMFRRSGAVHLLALSGMHLGVITALALCLLVPVIGRTGALATASAIAICYLVLIGPRPSLVRAAVMFMLGSYGYIRYGRTGRAFHLLMVTFYIHSVFFPHHVRLPGFQLSYLALGGILLFSGVVSRALPFRIPPPLRNLVAANLCAVLITSPLLVKSFGEIYPTGIVSSIVLFPFIIVFLCAGITYLFWSVVLCVIWSPLLLRMDYWIRLAMDRAAGFLMKLVQLTAGFPALRIFPEKWVLIALIAVSVLTLITLSHYACSYGTSRKLQFTKRDNELSESQWNGAHAPVWAELSDIPEGKRTDHRAA